MSEELLIPLVRLLAQGHGQREISSILNEKGLLRPDGERWNQAAVSRFMNQWGIVPQFTFNVFPEYVKEKNYS